jgi:hypothetical protein
MASDANTSTFSGWNEDIVGNKHGEKILKSHARSNVHLR